MVGGLAACSDDGGGLRGASYADASAVAEALGCDDSFEESEDGEAFEIGTPPESSGSCDFEGGVSISVYGSEEAAEQAFRAAETIGCSFAEGFGIERFVFAAGPNWEVTLEDNLDDGAVEAAAEAADGTAREVNY